MMFFKMCLHTIMSPKACRKFKEDFELLASLFCFLPSFLNLTKQDFSC